MDFSLVIQSNLVGIQKVDQIYVPRNQLHCTANLNFGLMCKKGKTLLGFVN